MKMWALFSYHVCMYEIHVKWYMTCDMNWYMSMNVCQDMNCMYDVMKVIWICMIMKCMHDSWIEITAMSSSRMTNESYLATVVGGIVLGTYHWGCRWYCLLGSIAEDCRCIGRRISITEVKRILPCSRSPQMNRLKSHDWWLYHGHKKCTLRGQWSSIYSSEKWIIRQCIVAYGIWHRMIWLMHDMIGTCWYYLI